MIKELIKVANRLDSMGLKVEADRIDGMIRRIASSGDSGKMAEMPKSSSGEYSTPFDSASYIANRMEPMNNDGDVNTVFGYIIAAFGETFGFKNPYYKIIGGYDGRGFTLASNTLDCLGMSQNDFKRYVKHVEEDVVHQRMMSQYRKNIESLPDEDPRKIRFYEEIRNIISVLRDLGEFI